MTSSILILAGEEWAVFAASHLGRAGYTIKTADPYLAGMRLQRGASIDDIGSNDRRVRMDSGSRIEHYNLIVQEYANRDYPGRVYKAGPSMTDDLYLTEMIARKIHREKMLIASRKESELQAAIRLMEDLEKKVAYETRLINVNGEGLVAQVRTLLGDK